MEVRCSACGAINRVPEARIGERARCGRCHAPLPAGAADVPPGRPVTVTDADFETRILKSPTPVLLDCWADWCGPCHALAPTIDALARDYAGRVVVAKLDVDANPATADRFAIRGIPTLLLFRDGRLIDRLTGVQPRGAIEARLRPLLGSA
jgi:thioredoxin 2